MSAQWLAGWQWQGFGGKVTDENAGVSAGRRDFLYVATGSVGAVAAAAAVWPLIDQMNPDASVRAVASIDVNVADITPGMQITVSWRGKPVFIRRRTAEEIEASRAVDLNDLPDGEARNGNLAADADAADRNRTLDDAGEWLVMLGVCTHFGCVPVGDAAGEYGGWFCPCHGSHYDAAGRIRKGPAPENLPVPVARFLSDNVIRLG